MREVKFRGKRIIDPVDNGAWVYGNFAETFYLPEKPKKEDFENPKKQCHIIDEYGYYEEITPRTVGQYTGLKDKNGKEVYDGDKLQDCYEKKHVVVIIYTGGQFVGLNMDENHPLRETQNRNWLQWEIIGNKFESSEI